MRRSKKLGTDTKRNREILVERLVKDNLVDEAVRVLKRKLKKNNEVTAKYVLDQVMGTAPKKTELSGEVETHVKANLYLPEKSPLNKKTESGKPA